jgi:hypothetical protein
MSCDKRTHTHTHTQIKSQASVSRVMFSVSFDSELWLLDIKSCNETTSANNYYLTLQTPHTKIKNTCLGKLLLCNSGGESTGPVSM